MASSQTMFGLDPKKIASLLKLGSGTRESEPVLAGEQEKADALRGLLAERLSNVDLAPEGWAEKAICTALEKPLQDHILDRKTPTTILRRIKEYGAKRSRSAQSEAERQSATVIYYAAIANALVWQHEKITALSMEDLATSFSMLEKLPWLTQGIVELFRQAMHVYRNAPEQGPCSSEAR